MELSKIDKNFDVQVKQYSQNQDLYTLPNSSFDIYGVFYSEEDKQFLRMDLNVAKSVSNAVYELSKFTAGGRIRFSTNSSLLSLRVKQSPIQKCPHISELGSSGFVLLEDEENSCRYVCSFMANHYLNKNELVCDDGYYMERTISEDKKIKNYTLFLPNYNDLQSLTIGVEKGSFIGHGKIIEKNKPILYYGSSITQGACASRPDNSYQGFIFKWTNIDFINLGFSGACLAEQQMIDYVDKIDCSIFVCDYDHNAPSLEHLQNTHYHVYQEFRKRKPDVPYVMISMPSNACGNWDERRKIIFDSYQKAIKNGDQKVYFIDGSSMFKADQDSCTVDGTHPNDLGLYFMAQSIFSKFKNENLL